MGRDRSLDRPAGISGPPRFLRANQKPQRFAQLHGMCRASGTPRLVASHPRPARQRFILIRTEEARRTTGNTESRMLLAESLTEQVIGLAIEVHLTPARACLRPSMNSACVSSCGARPSGSRGRSPFRCSKRASRSVTVSRWMLLWLNSSHWKSSLSRRSSRCTRCNCGPIFA